MNMALQITAAMLLAFWSGTQFFLWMTLHLLPTDNARALQATRRFLATLRKQPVLARVAMFLAVGGLILAMRGYVKRAEKEL